MANILALFLVLSSSAFAASPFEGSYAVKSIDECIDGGKRAECDTQQIRVIAKGESFLVFEYGTSMVFAHELVQFSNGASLPQDIAMATLQVTADSIRWDYINNPKHIVKIVNIFKNPHVAGEYFMLVQDSLSNNLADTSQRAYTLKKD